MEYGKNMEGENEKIRKMSLFRRSKEKDIRKLLKEFWYDKCMNESAEMDDYVPEIMQEEVYKYLGKRGDKGRYNFAMFTVNFREDVKWGLVKKKFEKYRKKVWIEKELSCVEWRDGDKGLHIHSKVWIRQPTEGERKVYSFKREVYNTFKSLVGNRLHVNVRYSNKKGCFDEYIMRIKGGEKKKNFENNVVNRVKLGVKNVL